MLAAMKLPINGMITVIDNLIQSIDRIHVNIPHIPGTSLGGTVGFDIATIPHLAAGGIVPATAGGTLAMLGEAGSPEAVIPLDKYGIGPGNGGVHVEGGIHIYVAGSLDSKSAPEIEAAVTAALEKAARSTKQALRAGHHTRPVHLVGW